ncbi:hypothetical protein MTP99_007145 [Tenebrio molitor]|nr:hypothetical protein MTP99_007145 [Tenebrio molitor]
MRAENRDRCAYFGQARRTMPRDGHQSEMGDMCVGCGIVRIATSTRFPHIERQMVNVQGCFSKDLLATFIRPTPSYPFTFMQFDPFIHPVFEQ